MHLINVLHKCSLFIYQYVLNDKQFIFTPKNPMDLLGKLLTSNHQ